MIVKYAQTIITEKTEDLDELLSKNSKLEKRVASIKVLKLDPKRYCYLRNRAISSLESYGPNCIYNHKTRVYTLEGWKQIKDIKEGDLVLTHKGRFRKVLRTFRRKAKESVRIVYKLNNSFRSLTVTSEHPILTSSGWKEAKDLKVGDKIRILVNRCPVEKVARLVANHTHSYEFSDIEVVFIEKKTYNQLRAVYNLEVEEDNSYIVGSGFVVHNCNFDAWEREELESRFLTFIGSRVTIDHQENLKIGIVLDSEFIYPKYDKNGKLVDGDFIENILSIDKKKTEELRPGLIDAIMEGKVTGTSMGCFPPGTQILMGDGTVKNIEEVKEGDFVLTGEGKPAKVTKTFKRYYKGPLYSIKSTAYNKNLVCTFEHPILVSGRIDSTQKIGLSFVCPICGRSFRQLRCHTWQKHPEIKNKEFFDYKEAKDLLPKEFVCFPRIKFGTKNNIKLARLLGFYLAEGSIGFGSRFSFIDKERDEGVCPICREKVKRMGVGSHFKRHGKEKLEQYRIKYPASLWLSFGPNEQDLINEAKQIVLDLFPETRVYEGRTEIGEIIFWNEKLASTMLELGGKLAENKKINFTEILTWTKESILSLLSGYLDGDGFAYQTGFSIATISKDLAYQILFLLKGLGVYCRLEFRGSKVENRFDSWAIVGLATNSGSFNELKEKSKILKRCYYQDGEVLVQYRFSLGRRCLVSSKDSIDENTKLITIPRNYKAIRERNFRITDDFIFFKIWKIISIYYSGFVYNLEVEKDHSYIANGITVHNCLVGWTRCSVCNNIAYEESQYCEHIPAYKGKKVKTASGEERLVYEICKDVTFFEDSIIIPKGMNWESLSGGVPADPKARLLERLASKNGDDIFTKLYSIYSSLPDGKKKDFEEIIDYLLGL